MMIRFDPQIDYKLLQTDYENIVGEPPDNIYHYTDLNGLTGILGKGLIWATHPSYLNDKKELKLTRSIIRDRLKYKIKNVTDPNIQFYLKEILVQIEKKRRYGIYVTSFSDKKDNTNQYIKYAKGDQKFCLEFNVRMFYSGLPSPSIFAKVVYNNNSQVKIVDSYIDKILNYIKSLNLQCGIDHNKDKVFIEYGTKSLDFLAPLFKSSQWEDEQEVRLIIPRMHVQWFYIAKINKRGGKKIPYMEIPVNTYKGPLKQIAKIFYVANQTKIDMLNLLKTKSNSNLTHIKIQKSDSELQI